MQISSTNFDKITLTLPLHKVKQNMLIKKDLCYYSCHIFDILLAVNCQMSEWGPCNATCGEGAIKTRNITIPAKNGGIECQHVTEFCHLQPCPGKLFIKGSTIYPKIVSFLE